MTNASKFAEYSTVRLVQLEQERRWVSEGTEGISRPPEIGDVGTVVDFGESESHITYIVEKIDPGGGTVWVAEFLAQELELVEDDAASAKGEPVRKSHPGAVAAALAVGIAFAAVTVALVLCKLVVGAVSAWVVIGVAAAFGFLGSITGERLGDAILLTVISSIITVIAFSGLPLPPLWRQVWLAGGSGICVGKLVTASYREFWAD